MTDTKPTATIIECDDEYVAPDAYFKYSPGWGYRIDATGEVVNGDVDGEHWQEDDAEQSAVAAGFEIVERAAR